MENFSEHIQKQSASITQAHTSFLKARQSAMQVIASMVSAQINRQIPHGSVGQHPQKKIIYNRFDLEEFATGSLEKVFGKEFAVYNQRRVPRIPNGDLLLFSRVTQLTGTPRNFDHPASITTEYDVPENAWYLINQAYAYCPFAIIQEIALQPCGFLSAWLGSCFLLPEQDLYFRNLDGQAKLIFEPDIRGKTITTNAHLTSTNVGGGTVIQKFHFDLAVEGESFFEGESVFGYFQAAAMANQVGLDGGKSVPPPPFNAQPISGRPDSTPNNNHLSLPVGQLNMLNQAEIEFSRDPQSGTTELLMKKTIDPQDWYFTCHFFQDPVMPGSLGVEAAFQLVQAYVISEKLGKKFHKPGFALIPGQPIMWKYRGQITRKTRQMTIKVKLKPQQPGETIILGDASVWADQVRIYDIKNFGIKLIQTEN